MITPAPTTHTVREQIMQHLKERFESVESPYDDDDVYPLVWNYVTRKPITKGQAEKYPYLIGFYDTTSRIREGMQYDMHNLNVVIEFHVRLMESDEPSTFLNHCLGQIVKRIGQDIHMGGLALNAREAGSELDIDGGVIVFDITFRTRANDPYTRV